MLAPTSARRPKARPHLSAELRTLVDVARWRAAAQAEEIAFTFLVDGQSQEEHLTYAGLDRRARAVAAELQARGLAGERVLLLFHPGLDFNVALLACLYAGAVAVPVYPPDAFRAHRTLPRLEAIFRDAQAVAVLGCREILSWAGSWARQTCGTTVLEMELLGDAAADDWKPPAPDEERLALLQYTSGSTGTPRGVMLTHANLTHNLEALRRLDADDAVAVCWVPPFHDMGLIGGIMLPIHVGRRMVLMSPLSFVQHPARWLWAIARYRARTSPSPNFGFELCLRKVTDEECEGLDLSCWKAAINGAEPVRADTIDRFAERFARYGFRREAFFPAFGMAESTLLVTCGQPEDPIFSPAFSAPALAEDRVEQVEADGASARRLVGCGRPIAQSDLVIVEPRTRRRAAPGRVGEIWIRSPSVGLGYWNRPEETERVFGARLAGENGEAYLRTGDLGFVHQGALFVTGRLKELIILGGRNYYPQDIEAVVRSAHAAIKADGCAAVSAESAEGEQLAIVAEVLRPKRVNLDEVIRAIRREVADALELTPCAVVLIPAGTLPKTSSGKTRRRAIREELSRREITALAQWWAHDAAPHGGPGTDDPPRGALEESLAAWFAEVLGVPAVGRGEDFFALGGHSLPAVQLAARIAEALGIETPLAVLFQHPTVADLAAWIEARQPAATGPSRGGISRLGADAPPVLSSAEQRLWFFDRLAPQHPFYNMPVAARLNGPLDADALEQALGQVVARHEALRTTYPSESGVPVRRVAASIEAPLGRVDLGAVPESERESELERRLVEEARRPFDLAAGPLARFVLYRLGPREHVLLMAMHHIVIDGWSIGRIAEEVGQRYAAIREGRRLPAAPLPLTCADFAAWQQGQLASGALDDDAAYWCARLSPEPPPLELPSDRLRPRRPSYRGGLRPIEVSADVCGAVRALAARENTTTFAVLMAAYNVVLSRFCRQTDVAVGTIVANRTRRELEPLVGFFANTLVIRSDLSADPTFRELLGRVRRTVLEAFDHQELPFDRLVERLAPNRPQDRAPLFQVALVLENMPLSLSTLEQVEVEPITIDNGTAKYDLALLLFEQGDRITGQAEYARDLFDAATIDRFLAAFASVLAAAVESPDRPISRLPLVDAEERRLLLDPGPSRAAAAPSSCLHELVEAHARRAPGAPAVRFRGRTWTYEEVDRAANRLAAALMQRGAKPDLPVSVLLERSAESVIALLGVLKSGAALVPLDPALPAERLAFLLKDTQARLVVTSRALAERLPVTGAEPVLIEDLALEVPGAGPRPRASGVQPENLAYILYTSGSTGRPKGVLIEHRGAAAFVAGFNRVLRIEPDCRVLHFFSASSDGTISDVFSALASGACLVVAGPETLHEHDALHRLMRGERVTTATLTPSMLPLLDPDELPDLHTVCSVGEAAPADLVARWGRPGRRLINGYGVTEAACGACLAELTSAQGTPSTIGRPLEHVRMYVLDEHLEPVPIGVPGEICIGGVQVGRGYLNRPEQTARSFVTDPFRDGPDARLYRTGDLGRRLADGSIVLVGRFDQQVKIHGFRVEPGEIAAVLEQHPRVEQAAVVAREDQPGEVRLAAYVVVREPGPASELRTYLTRRLPRHMVPASIVMLDALPRTLQGKIDHAALPAPADRREGRAAVRLAPRDAPERLVAEVWRELLSLDRVGVDEDFFELGGHSMLAVQVMSQIERRSGRRLPLSAFFHEPTVEHLARLLRRPDGEEPEAVLVPLATGGAGRPLFCVHPAGGTVFCYRALAEQLAQTRPVYGIQAVGIDGQAAAHRRIDQMAAHYVEAMRSVQPTGPYLLAGWSLGGNVAQEMACQLTEQGDEVGMLALLDAAALPTDRRPDAADFLPMLMEFFPQEDHLPLEEIQAMPVAEQLEFFMRRAGQAGIAAQGDLAAAHHVFEVFKSSMQAVVEHRQRPFAGKVTLFAAQQRESWLGRNGDDLLGWEDWADEVEVLKVPGGHIQMVHPPYVRALGEALSGCLGRAGGERRCGLPHEHP